MLDNEQDLVKVLETELRFLDNGGYRDPDMWRPQFIFLDSATCVHPAGSGRPEACADCPLIGFVPRARRSAPVPCHHSAQTREGFTVDSVTGCGTQEEVGNALRGWLTEKIEALRGCDYGSCDVNSEMKAFCNRMAG